MKKMTLKSKSGLKEVLLELSIVCIVALALITMQSCDNKKDNSTSNNEHNDGMNSVNTKTEDPKDVAEDHNDAKFNKDTEKEAQLMG
jgi:hypothetical protein